MSNTKKPRRTAERILETALALFNRFGEPHVSIALIAAELGISPGNLHYHYPAKDGLINLLFQRYEQAQDELLAAAPGVAQVEDAWLFFHMLHELIWDYRFLYRDLNDLLSRNRQLEIRFQALLQRQTQALQALLASLARHGSLNMSPADQTAFATSMVLALTYWLSFAYVRAPRRALEPEQASATLNEGVWQLLSLLGPCLAPSAREHLAHGLQGLGED